MELNSGLILPDDKIAEICRKYKVREMAVFGSAARGDLRPESDIDVLVELRPDAHLGWEFFGIAEELENVLGRRVDLGTKDSLKPYARPSAFREAVVVYAE
jgi:predicted nucleotidyltransferase